MEPPGEDRVQDSASVRVVLAQIYESNFRGVANICYTMSVCLWRCEVRIKGTEEHRKFA
jgi:hypothetical protein